jgi:hypothetical protein
VAEAKLHELTLAVATNPVPPPSATPAPTPAAPPVFRVPEVKPQPPGDPYADPDPSPQELADALRTRNEILLGGLTLLPESKPPAATPGDLRQMLPGGVYAIPRYVPKKPQPIFPDDND